MFDGKGPSRIRVAEDEWTEEEQLMERGNCS